MKSNFELFAFYSNAQTLDMLIEADIDGIIVDWENKGKSNRQDLYNTQVNEHTAKDLEIVGKKEVKNLICRINGPGYWSKEEINLAIELGASELLIPMIKSIDEVKFILDCVKNRIKISLMLETNEALMIIEQLDKMPVHRFFVGLNDLSIQRSSRNIFSPFVDGTIDVLRPKISKKFGIAGLTHPLAGDPVPCSLLIKQMKKYDASFGFLRRSFYKDLNIYGVQEIINELRMAFHHNDRINTLDLTLEEELLFSQDLI